MKPPGTNKRVPNIETLPYRGTSAGGGYSTAGDLARFAQALLSHQLLRPESTRMLITGKTEHAPGASYAYGFEDHRDTHGNGWVGHNGGAPGMNGSLLMYPHSRYITVVLANTESPSSRTDRRLARRTTPHAKLACTRGPGPSTARSQRRVPHGHSGKVVSRADPWLDECMRPPHTFRTSDQPLATTICLSATAWCV